MTNTENTFGAFMAGFLIGIVITVILSISAISSNKVEITADKKIVPEWRLTTDGKKIDTLYIYKQK